MSRFTVVGELAVVVAGVTRVPGETFDHADATDLDFFLRIGAVAPAAPVPDPVDREPAGLVTESASEALHEAAVSLEHAANAMKD